MKKDKYIICCDLDDTLLRSDKTISDYTKQKINEICLNGNYFVMNSGRPYQGMSDFIERLELKVRPLVKELRYYFTGKTTLNIESDFIVFNIKELMNSDTNIRNALLFNVLKFAWGLCLNPNVNTVLSVDEAHVLLGAKNELGAEFLAQVQRRARKYNTGTIIITQQPSDFVADGILMHGKAIFDNASYYLVMGLKKQAVEDLSMLVDLNDNEKESIKRFSQGEALFVCGNRRMQINVIVTEDELESFGSGGGL